MSTDAPTELVAPPAVRRAVGPARWFRVDGIYVVCAHYRRQSPRGWEARIHDEDEIAFGDPKWLKVHGRHRRNVVGLYPTAVAALAAARDLIAVRRDDDGVRLACPEDIERTRKLVRSGAMRCRDDPAAVAARKAEVDRERGRVGRP